MFGGIRELVEIGVASNPLPDYVSKAPNMKSTTITVDHGEFGADSFAAV